MYDDVSSCLFMKTRSRPIGKRTECDREATQIKAQTSNIEHDADHSRINTGDVLLMFDSRGARVRLLVCSRIRYEHVS